MHRGVCAELSVPVPVRRSAPLQAPAAGSEVLEGKGRKGTLEGKGREGKGKRESTKYSTTYGVHSRSILDIYLHTYIYTYIHIYIW